MATAEEQKQKRDPFSPLQTGCAFVMLTNLLIYLAVVAFVFDILDPSKLTSDYLLRRGFTMPDEKESEEDKAFRDLEQRKREETQQVQEGMVGIERSRIQDESPAMKLSELSVRPLASSRPAQQGLPKAALTEGRPGGYGGGTRSAKSRQYSLSVYPQATLRKSYSPLKVDAGKTVTPQRYDTVAVELAPGLDYPVFRVPSVFDSGEPVYSPSKAVPDPVKGERKLSAPSRGASPAETNRTQSAQQKPEDPGEP